MHPAHEVWKTQRSSECTRSEHHFIANCTWSQPWKNPRVLREAGNKCSALETMGKLREMNGYVRMTLDKVIGIRADLVRTDYNWQEWKFTHLAEALRKWTERNLLPMDHERSEHFNEKLNHKQPKRDRIFQAKQQDWKPARTWVYCGASEYKSSEFDKVVDVAERRKHLSS